MEREEYYQQVNELTQKYIKDRDAINEFYALSNNPHKIGDIIKDASKIIRVEKITTSFCRLAGLPVCVYYGPIYRADGIPSKKGGFGYVFQQDLRV